MLNEQISSDLKEAMKAKDADTLSTLRMLKSAVKNKEIDAQKELADEDIVAIIKMQVKQLREASDVAETAGRPETVEAAKREIALLEKYLPTQMDDVTLSQVVKDALQIAGATTKADTGKAMGAAMKAVGGRADGSRVKAVVESILTASIVAAVVFAAAHPALAATASAAKDASMIVSGARIARVFLMLMGLVSVLFIVMGSVTVMTASGRDHGHHHGLQQIGVGVFGTILMAGLIAIATATIQKLG